MTADKDFTFEPIPSDPPIVEAVPTPTPDYTASGHEEEHPSDTAILAGCGLIGWVVGGPFLALLTALGGNWAKKKQGPFGESTRAIGRIAEAAGKKTKDEKLFGKVKHSIGSLFHGKKSTCEHCNCENSNLNLH
eukprot:CAMPEP_0201689576 /NCGR_PEP_ID=MMETSP0578-20130828/3134_1 /ASSEMBLY_ACC=CAM_ASM_000663 /TAXON_ID=267565 /ORGANISM="Skeletonema grethea, Strain CCMP 1804" /LENGTH=133 /DNA_ID=CAMNT_0048174261 /DNA_START=49 /DNA_END=450 /DNA_ORIENTATION=-